MPQLKAHLQAEWEEEARRGKAVVRKRKRDDARSNVSDGGESDPKRPSPEVV